MVSEYNLYSLIKRLHTVEKCSWWWECSNMKHVSRGSPGQGRRGGRRMVFSGDRQTMGYCGDLPDTGVCLVSTTSLEQGRSHAVVHQIFLATETRGSITRQYNFGSDNQARKQNMK